MINHTFEKGPANLQSPLKPKPSRDGGGSRTMTEHERERRMGQGDEGKQESGGGIKKMTPSVHADSQ